VNDHAPVLGELDLKAVDTARLLAADAVQKVGNGHPGTAMSLAPLAYLLYQKVLRHDPADPRWVGRDRFVLSAGHSSLTQYVQLYLAGFGVELDDLKALRTWGSLTPGHPEFGHTNGVEVTTGPLGQGLANAVGMAMAARRERGLFDPEAAEGTSPFDHHVFAIASDGDLEEGVTSEASSIAGTQELGNLIVFWDDNQISIEDDTSIAFTEDVVARYDAYGWHTQSIDFTAGGEYHEDVDALAAAIEAAKAETSRPSFIRLKTIIGWPAPTKQGTGGIHGSALGAEEVAATKEILGFDPSADFAVDVAVIGPTRHPAAVNAAAAKAEWTKAYDAWRAANPERATLLDRLVARDLPEGWTDALPEFEADKAVSTRAASGKVLSALADTLPELWGGSADLAGSNNTTMDGEPSFLPERRGSKKFPGNKYGRTLHFGIREHAMGSIINGIAAGGVTRPYAGTFLVFSDYMRGAVRVAAIMGIPSTFVWTHDSIGVGEDGPTHQPVEHLTALRAIPRLDVVRPADAAETAVAWRGILERTDRPAGLILSRQNLPNPARGGDSGLAEAEDALKGGYVLADTPTGSIDVLLLATGSEVQLALAARETLAAEGVGARVVSLPSFEWFAEQDEAYRAEVLPADVKARVSVEAGLSLTWLPFIGEAGRSVSVEDFGASAAGDVMFEKLGITADAVVAAARESIEAAKA
jgi:transketolase